MIFAAGLGTRLYPITEDRPKALAPFLDGTLLEYNLRFLADQGIDHFVINTHHFAEKVLLYLERNKFFGLHIDISFEKNLLDTAGGLGYARRYFIEKDSPVLLYNVDVISNLDVSSFISAHNHHNSQVSLAMRDRHTSRNLLFDKESRLRGWRNNKTNELKPPGIITDDLHSLAFSGIHLLGPEVLQMLDADKKYSLIDFYLENIQNLNIHGIKHQNDYWYDCGKPETLKVAENFISKKMANKA